MPERQMSPIELVMPCAQGYVPCLLGAAIIVIIIIVLLLCFICLLSIPATSRPVSKKKKKN